MATGSISCRVRSTGSDSGTGKSVTICRYLVLTRVTGRGISEYSLLIISLLIFQYDLSNKQVMQNQESAGWIRRTLATQEEFPLKLIWLLLLPAPVAVFAQAAMPPPNSSYVGSAVCKGCHPDVWMNFPKN